MLIFVPKSTGLYVKMGYVMFLVSIYIDARLTRYRSMLAKKEANSSANSSNLCLYLIYLHLYLVYLDQNYDTVSHSKVRF